MAQKEGVPDVSLNTENENEAGEGEAGEQAALRDEDITLQLQCGICRKFVTENVECPNCHRLFCAACIKAQKNKTFCPECKKQTFPDKDVPDLYVKLRNHVAEKLSLQLFVICAHCGHSFSRAQMPAHEKDCKKNAPAKPQPAQQHGVPRPPQPAAVIQKDQQLVLPPAAASAVAPPPCETKEEGEKGESPEDGGTFLDQADVKWAPPPVLTTIWNLPTFKPTIWQEDKSVPACQICNRKFGMFLRKHHCRCCGHIFCSGCSSERRGRWKVRVCDLCSVKLRVLFGKGV